MKNLYNKEVLYNWVYEVVKSGKCTIDKRWWNPFVRVGGV